MKLTTKDKILLPLRAVLFVPIFLLLIAEIILHSLSAFMLLLAFQRYSARKEWKKVEMYFQP